MSEDLILIINNRKDKSMQFVKLMENKRIAGIFCVDTMIVFQLFNSGYRSNNFMLLVLLVSRSLTSVKNLDGNDMH